MAKELDENFDAMLREFDSDWRKKLPEDSSKNLKNPKLPSLDDLELESQIPNEKTSADKETIAHFSENDYDKEKDFEPITPLEEEFEGELSPQDDSIEDLDSNESDDEGFQQVREPISEEDLTNYERDRYKEEDEEEYYEDLNEEPSSEKAKEVKEETEDFDEYDFGEEDEIEDPFMEDPFMPQEPPKTKKENKLSSPKKEERKENDNSLGSDADEKAKAFFMNLKEKAMGMFKKKNKTEKQKSKKVKGSSAEKEKRGGSIPKPNFKSLSKKQKIISAVAIVILIALLGLFFFSGSSYKPLGEIIENTSAKVDGEEIDFSTSRLTTSGKVLGAKFTNTGDISSNVSLNLTLFEKSLNPFGGEIINCKSDIINMEGTNEQELSCNKTINSEKKFKLKVEVEDF